MSSKVSDYLKKLVGDKSGVSVIRFDVNIAAGEEISFRVDANKAYIDWGDGERSEEIRMTRMFSHRYRESGVYQAAIYGKNLVDIDMPHCHLVSLDVSECRELEFIDCSYNQLTKLDITNCNRLYELYCTNNQLQELKLGKHEKLFYLSCSCNELQNLMLEGCPSLVNLRCRNNHLHTLNVSSCPQLITVTVAGNIFTPQSMMDFLQTLNKRPQGDRGFVVFRNNFEEECCNGYELQNCLTRQGWREL